MGFIITAFSVFFILHDGVLHHGGIRKAGQTAFTLIFLLAYLQSQQSS
jgi:hypothetical protein